jgi:hypothetical protein
LSRHGHGREPKWLAGWSLFTILRHGSCYTLPPDFSTSTTWLHCEDVPIVNSSRSRTLESMHKIHGILGVPVLIDAAVVGSRAHHPRFWWINLAPAELLQSAIGRTKRLDVYASDILDPHQTP